MAQTFTDKHTITVKNPVSIFNNAKLEAIKYRVEYIETGVNNLEGDKITLRSPVFHIGNDHEYQARIICFFKGGCDYVEECTDDGCCYVQFLSGYGPKPSNHLKIVLSHGMNTAEKTSQLFSRDGNPSWGVCSKDFVTNNLYHFACYDSTRITILCDITLPASVSTAQVNPDILQNRLLEDISALFGNEELSDVNISVGSKIFKAHKAILSARSPVFARMFQSEMSERQLSVVEITDMDPEEVQCLLVYMYTDTVGPGDHAEGLMAAADKYQLDGLKAECEAALGRSLTVQNAARLLVLADLHRAKTLKAKAVNFINKNKMEVAQTEGWKLAKETRPLELVALFL